MKDITDRRYDSIYLVQFDYPEIRCAGDVVRVPVYPPGPSVHEPLPDPSQLVRATFKTFKLFEFQEGTSTYYRFIEVVSPFTTANKNQHDS